MSIHTNNETQTMSWVMLGWITGGFFLVTLFVFGASLSYGFSSLDDRYLVLTNLAIRGPTLAHLHRIFTSFDPELYIPITLFSYQINYLLGGLEPGIYHFTNLLLHALNGALVAWKRDTIERTAVRFVMFRTQYCGDTSHTFCGKSSGVSGGNCTMVTSGNRVTCIRARF